MALEKANRELVQVRKQIDDQREQIKQQELHIEELRLANEKLETANRLLKVDYRLAHIKVLEVSEDEETKSPITTVEFQEVTESGERIGDAKKFTLKGRQIHVSGWIVKFNDRFIEEADLDRATSLFMFRNIYGENEAPSTGQSLEEKWSRPEAYARGSKISDFEQGIWDNFWLYANNPKKSEDLGIRAAHGQANFIQAEEGTVYEVNLRASDGLSIRAINPDKQKKVNTEDPDTT